MTRFQRGLPALARSAGLLLPWLAFWGAIVQNVADPDLFGYMAFGRLFFESPGFPREDVFSYYPVKSPWVYHEWLTGVVFYKIWDAAGPWALQALKYLLAFGSLGLAWATARKNGAGKGAAAACLLMAVWDLAQGWSPVRAQAFTYFFFALVLFALEEVRRGGGVNALLALAPVFWLWSNLHGGFLAGLGVFFLYAGCQEIAGRRGAKAIPGRASWAAFTLSALLTLCNPYGLDSWICLGRSVLMPRPFIVEWWSLPKAALQGFYLPASVLFLGMVLIAAAMLPKIFKAHVEAGALLTLLAFLGFLHHRHGVFFALGFAALVPPYVPWRKPGRFREWVAASLFALGLLANVALAGIQGIFLISGSPFALRAPGLEQSSPNAPYYPAGAVEHIRRYGLRGNALTDFHWGEYLIWSLHPACKVAVDGRYETVYREETVREHFLCFENPRARREDFFAYLEKRPTDMVIAPALSAAQNFLAQDPGWSLAYEDAGCALFVRQEKSVRGEGGNDQSLAKWRISTR